MSGTVLHTITGTSPASATTAIVGNPAFGLEKYDWFMIDAALAGAAGGVLDVYLQRQIANVGEVAGGVWADWLHFTQLAASAAAIKYTMQSGTGLTITTVAHGTDASAGTPVLAANTFIGGHPGHAVRCVCVGGAGTTAGAAVTIYITGWGRRF